MIPVWVVPLAKGVWKFLRGIPWQVWLALAVGAAFYAYGEHKESTGETRGRAEVQARWNAAIERGKAELVKRKEKQGAVTVRVETKYVDRVKVIREKGQTIVRKVPVYVPAGSCDLPPGFRVLHDAAAANTIPDPAGIPDAAAVPAQDAATTVADNYLTCHETAARLTALQEWVRGQQKVNQ